ncbi:MAG: glycosyltransferase [Phycisphaerae bacterium]|nr:glycosyltransferase [Phycisphaerae bacterium]
MRVFMLGWEFPPHISGGLGTACYGLTKGLDELGVGVCFVLPQAVPPEATSHVSLRTPAHVPADAMDEASAESIAVGHIFENVDLRPVAAVLQPYATPATYKESIKRLIAQKRRSSEEGGKPEQVEALEGALQEPIPRGPLATGAGLHYDGDLMAQVYRYARLALEIARAESFDVIHAHDWMTYPAGLAVAAATHKPLVVHVHSTEFDRSGDNVNTQVYEIERTGMHGADRVVCVSYLTRSIVTSRYGVPADRIEVVYNAVELPAADALPMKPIRHDEKIVLFLGRITMQKGPEYFLMAAKKVIAKYSKVRFIVAGSGDMIAPCVELTASLKLGSHVTFTGFLRGGDVDRVFRMADLYVMPSVSEPFGIAPLEALSHNVPVIISRQSGVSEVLTHVLKVDFWDTDEMANKILAVLRHPPLQKTLRDAGQIELKKLSWRDSAAQLKHLYADLTVQA